MEVARLLPPLNESAESVSDPYPSFNTALFGWREDSPTVTYVMISVLEALVGSSCVLLVEGCVLVGMYVCGVSMTGISLGTRARKEVV